MPQESNLTTESAAHLTPEAQSDPNAEAFSTLTQVDRDDSNFEDNKESVFDFVLANQLHIPLPTPITSKEVSGLPPFP